MSLFTKTLYVILFLALLLQPHFARHIGVISRPYVESFTTAGIASISYLIYYLHKRQLRRQTDQLKVYDQQVSKLQHQAFHDPLTGLPNRLLMKDRISTALARAKRYDKQVAIMFLDLDKFKYINDKFGHAVGDLLLQEVSMRLSRHTREIDTVARLGGDEFVVVLNELDSRNAITNIAENILETLNRPYQIQGFELTISVSIGIAVYPDHGQHEDVLLKLADDSLYETKKQGGRNYKFYELKRETVLI